MTQIGGDDPRFQPTQWSVVRRAVQKDPASTDAREALSELAQSYWKPVYVYIRRRGHDVETAKDLTQAFFARLVERGGLERVDSQRGRFRTYLLGAVNFHLAQQAERERAQKRGGGRALLSLDDEVVALEARVDPEDETTPEAQFERAWAREVLDRALDRLRQRLQDEGKPRYFDVLMASLDPDQPSYSQIGERLGLSTSDVTNFLHRARKRYRQALLAEVMPSVETLADAEDELRELIRLIHGEPKGPPDPPGR